MKEVTNNGVTYLTFPALDATGIVTHAFSTRMGGVSEGWYSTMNFSFTRGDNREHVLENYSRMAAALGVKREKMVLTWQTHTTNIRVVSEDDLGKGVVKERDYRDIDGLLTMKREYGSRPEDLVCCVGPSICSDCYEVGEDVADKFYDAFSKEDCRAIVLPSKTGMIGKRQLDLWEANRRILLEAGVPEKNISVTDICTRCNPGKLFSHRAMGEKRGNLCAFLALKEN